MREDIRRIVEDAERKQAAYAARRQWWGANWTRAVQIVDATPHQPVIRTADMQAVVDATRDGG